MFYRSDPTMNYFVLGVLYLTVVGYATGIADIKDVNEKFDMLFKRVEFLEAENLKKDEEINELKSKVKTLEKVLENVEVDLKEFVSREDNVAETKGVTTESTDEPAKDVSRKKHSK